jgi:hypothetical protein
MSETQTNDQLNSLSKQVEDLNQKVDSLNAKMEKNAADSAALIAQTQTLVNTTNANKSAEIMRQTVASPTGIIAKEASNYVIKTLEKNQKSKTTQWMATRGRTVVEQAIESYITQKLPQVNWYGTSVTGTQTQDKYHVKSHTNFPVEINTGVPFVGKVTIARVGLEVECDVNNKNNETSNFQCRISSENPGKDLFDSIQEDLTGLLKPHKIIWSIVRPIGLTWISFIRFMKKETNFSIPFIILLIFTIFIYPRIFPAAQIWNNVLHYQTPYFGLFGIRPINILWGIINGIIWGAFIWLAIRFKFFPGLGKAISYMVNTIFPAIKRFFMNPYRRWGTVIVVLAAIVVIILWRIGVFEPPPPLQLSSLNIPNGRAATEYQYNLKVEGGKSPYVTTIENSTLPSGIAFDPVNVKLSGIPTEAGNYVLKMVIKDSSKTAKTVSQEIKLNIAQANSVFIVNTSLPVAKIGSAYSTKIQTSGGSGTLRWGIISGQLPPGIKMDTSGTFTGTPLNRGSFTFIVTVGDSSPTLNVFNQTYTITVK